VRRVTPTQFRAEVAAAPPGRHDAHVTFTEESVPDQAGKVAVITGANSGIGYEATRVLAARGARVVLACRDTGKMADAVARLKRELPSATLDTVQLDLSSLAAIRRAAATLLERYPRIDLLINNAGVMAIPYRETADGFEMQFGTNHLGHFALTALLVGRVRAATAGRVVTVSSLLHRNGKLVLEDIPKPAKYDEKKAYSMSKLANLLFAYELDRRLKAGKSRALSVACHPGYSDTNLQSVGPSERGSSIGLAAAKLANRFIAQPAAMGALSTLMAATDENVRGGEYVGPTALFTLRGHPVIGTSNEASHDVAMAQKLWEISEKLCGVRFDLAS
jgi:NAD(P)-dependent dehydrogenase (short-subunit alcohol dehydrogenase family)